MRHFALNAHLTGFSADEAYARISTFDAFVDYSDVIREISVTAEAGGEALSSWEVNFYDGILRWTERDTFDPAARTIAFEQTTGDMDTFHGRWAVLRTADGVTVEFTASFDLGMPFIADVLDPIALDALDATISRLMTGLFGPGTRIEVLPEPVQV
ncbi:SRPBCC family protein [Actinomadura rubrisoli]|uniref:Polyketide cyclase n=1 Tax=Actinomadura rubrisoli TaxID=2530368 RepID=A0A4R5B2H1_9ACTN|nr:SRPBCC family protein [Actinomadura rubrisoli]TDD79193.1 polyketide cyclase [Actinomadura rubrisoli]